MYIIPLSFIYFYSRLGFFFVLLSVSTRSARMSICPTTHVRACTLCVSRNFRTQTHSTEAVGEPEPEPELQRITPLKTGRRSSVSSQLDLISLEKIFCTL